MYGLSDEDVLEMYELKVKNPFFCKQLSEVASRIAPLGSKLNKLAPAECKTVSDMMNIGFITSAEMLRYDTLCKHHLLTEAYRVEMELKRLFDHWLPHLSVKLTKNSIVLKRCGGTQCEPATPTPA